MSITTVITVHIPHDRPVCHTEQHYSMPDSGTSTTATYPTRAVKVMRSKPRMWYFRVSNLHRAVHSRVRDGRLRRRYTASSALQRHGLDTASCGAE